ncbi:MAG: lytic transglycosylase domain-containing protein [candidate division NC10 bacterium]|nr:lytic transglycosylase domain-containing protein [candidate division NC10 bacterium]
MGGKMYLVSEHALRLLTHTRRKYLAGMGIMVMALTLLGGYTLKLHWDLAWERASQASAYDPLYDEMMKEFDATRDDPHLRRYIIAKIMSLAKKYEIDPDLLFAVIAVESEFNTVAKSHKNARGLGQVMFTTAKAINPTLVEKPDDLYDVHVNLSSALKYLKSNMKRGKEDQRTALMVYYYGEVARQKDFRDRDNYVPKVLTYYDLLKSRRFGAREEAMKGTGLMPKG